MAKETEKRLLETLEFLQEPHGSTIPTIVKAMNIDGPQLSLKKIVQTLRGCLDNGLLKVADGRVKFKKILASDIRSDVREKGSFLDYGDRFKSKAGYSGSDSKTKGPKFSQKPMVLADADSPPPPEGEGAEGGDDGGNCPKCPECPKAKKKKRRCPKKKPKCPKPKKKPKCPKPKPKCPKPKPKCPKKKPKKCPQKKKIQPYCRKKKKCGD